MNVSEWIGSRLKGRPGILRKAKDQGPQAIEILVDEVGRRVEVLVLFQRARPESLRFCKASSIPPLIV